MQAPDLGQTLLRFQGNTMQAMYRGIARALAETCEPGVRDLRRPQVRPRAASMRSSPPNPTTEGRPHTSCHTPVYDYAYDDVRPLLNE